MLVLFAGGVPSVFAVVLRRYHGAVVADQRLRIVGEGGTALTNPNIHVRHRYRKLYEDYKPEFAYWKVVLLLRKCMFAAVVQLLHDNVGVQVRGPP